ncbi:MAG: chemotaxis protein CheB [Pseudomarimonas sp.]
MADVIPATPNVALLGRDDAVRTQLRTALAELGANLVYEGELRGASASAVSAKQPAVVLLNLDAEGEDALDSLEALLLDPSMRVVFNEAETTAALSGWDLARWARHLAAKVLGHDRTIPPPPAGAEYLPETDLMPTPGAPPSPESQSAALSMATLRSEATASVENVPASSAPAAGVRVTENDKLDAESTHSLFDIDHSDISAAIQSTNSAPAEVVRHSAQQSTPAAGSGATEAAINIDFDELDAALAVIDAGAENEFAGSFGASQGGMGEADSLSAELEALAQSTVVDSDAEFDLSVEDADDNISSSKMKFSSSADESITSDELDADVAALAAQLDAMADSAPKGEMDVRDPDFAFNIEQGEEPAPRQAVVRKAAAGIDFALEDELAEVQAAIPKPAPPPPKIDISFLSLEALPDPGLLVAPTKKKPSEEEVYLPRPGIDLTLAPRDAHLEVTPVVTAKPTHAAVEADLAQSIDFDSLTLEPISAPEKSVKVITRIPRVIVLGASIGGPDALRTFLAGLPADFPALLVLAQHLESGFFDRLAQQLQKVSKLPVRVASTDAPACVGEVMVVPSGERVKISRDGRVRREAYSGPTHYRPCIDDVMRDISDEFGKQATAIIFSGMAGDAVEGAVYLTANGGEVWAQTPASCVVSSMVDGAQARGVVEFVGSPRELADHCVARYGDGT